MWVLETEMVKEEQSSGMKAGVMLDGGIKGGSSIWELDCWISSWVRARWRLEVSSMKMMKVMKSKKKKNLIARLRSIDRVLQHRNLTFLCDLDKELQAALEQVPSHEESFWFKKSRSCWIEFGDRNTRYFHASVMQRLRHNAITALKDDNGAWCIDGEVLKSKAVNFY
ncbi:hypothetical protein V6N12_041997 [Hibiscus sabdariffa]|uniref:Uncharacterized protein n=1 Tax=Hibiscus sabdariffa TaxID=183260 RepID=A0ABR2EDI0_9ROSI